MLQDLPVEVLAQVAFHLCQPIPQILRRRDKTSDDHAADWAVPPVALLCTCRSVHSAISPANNPELYAKIFRVNFDVGAVYRRWGDGASRKVRAKAMTAELRRRYRALRHLEMIQASGDVTKTREEDLWVIYIMLLENGTS
jgi:hypothetical protein